MAAACTIARNLHVVVTYHVRGGGPIGRHSGAQETIKCRTLSDKCRLPIERTCVSGTVHIYGKGQTRDAMAAIMSKDQRKA